MSCLTAARNLGEQFSFIEAREGHHLWDWQGHNLAERGEWSVWIRAVVAHYRVIVWDVPPAWFDACLEWLLAGFAHGSSFGRCTLITGSRMQQLDAAQRYNGALFDQRRPHDSDTRLVVTRSHLPDLLRDVSRDTVIFPRLRALLGEVSSGKALFGKRRGPGLRALTHCLSTASRAWGVYTPDFEGELPSLSTWLTVTGRTEPLVVRLRQPLIHGSVAMYRDAAVIDHQAMAAIVADKPTVVVTCRRESAQAIAAGMSSAATSTGRFPAGWTPLLLTGRINLKAARLKRFLKDRSPASERFVVATIESLPILRATSGNLPYQLLMFGDTFPGGPAITDLLEALGLVEATSEPSLWAPGGEGLADDYNPKSEVSVDRRMEETRQLLAAEARARTSEEALESWLRGLRNPGPGNTVVGLAMGSLKGRDVPWRWPQVPLGTYPKTDMGARKKAAAAKAIEREVGAQRTEGEQAALAVRLRELGASAPPADQALDELTAAAYRCLQERYRTHTPVTLALGVLRLERAKRRDADEWNGFASKFDLGHHTARARLFHQLLVESGLCVGDIFSGEPITLSQDAAQLFYDAASVERAAMTRHSVAAPATPKRSMQQLLAMLRQAGIARVDRTRGTTSRRYTVRFEPSLLIFLRLRAESLDGQTPGDGTQPPPEAST